VILLVNNSFVSFDLDGNLAELAIASAGAYIGCVNSSELPAIFSLGEALENIKHFSTGDEPIDLAGYDKLVICGYIP